MSGEVYEKSEYHTIEWDDDMGAAVFTWETYEPGEEFRTSLNRLHDAIVEHGTAKYLVDTREIRAHDNEDKQWIAETWLPRMIDDGVRYGAGVYPDSAVADMDMEDIEEGVNQIADEFTFRAFTSRTEARNWLDEQ